MRAGLRATCCLKYQTRSGLVNKAEPGAIWEPWEAAALPLQTQQTPSVFGECLCLGAALLIGKL